MGNFQGGGDRRGGFRGGNSGGNRGGGFRGGNSGGRNRDISMHKAVCDECHKSCEVPFRPSNDKPIYCNECFSGKKGGNDRGGERKDFNSKPRREFGDRPRQSFSQNTNSNSDDLKKQLSEMNTKLDKLINAFEKLSQPKIVEVSKPVASVVTKKTPTTKVSVKKVVAKKTLTKKKK